jgi:bifunctional non-homologous end joining protein LigD
MGLNQYQKKRDFAKTPEPKGTVKADTHRLFIIQKHAASHLHYDFRLELHGVLKSWAVPKGPSLDPHVKRLAIHVEDHPVEYGRFEGIIPKGQYGGGTVMLWDKGTWEPLDKNLDHAYEKGHLRFILHAEKLHGRWDLIRLKDEKNWFLIKYDDEYACPQSEYDITEDLNKSALTRQTMDQIARHSENLWTHGGLEKNEPLIQIPDGMDKSPFPEFFSPQLATLVDKVPKDTQWLYEIKFDGYRILTFKKGAEVLLKSRNNIDWTKNLSPVAEAVGALAINNIVLDGEVVILDEQGKSDFQLLQNYIKNPTDSGLIYYIFDILYYDQYDLRPLPLEVRKAILENLLKDAPPMLKYSDHILNEGQAMFEHACNFGLEGIIAKHKDSTYTSKRSKEWLKIKCLKRQEFVIGGYTSPKGGRTGFGALLLGVYDNGELQYCGNVGTGFSETSLKELHKLLLKNTATSNPFNAKPPGYSQTHWVEPILVGEVEFTEWTKDGHLRHPSFKGLRMDKKASEVRKEQETPLKKVTAKSLKTKKSAGSFAITHPDKILYPEDGITKQDLLNYYETISDYILPFLSDRPLTLLRCPSDYNECFYQRHYNKTTPKALHPVEVDSEDGKEEYIYLNNKEGLLSLVQMGALEIHPWGSTIQHLELPDMIIFDLDPGPDVTWSQVVAGALEVRQHLGKYELESFVKSTGGKGLHVVIPVLPEYDWDAVKDFAHIFVQFLEQLKPEEYTSNMSKMKRKGKIFVDYLRNQRTATAIGTYSTRARIHAPVSTPLAWDELSDRIENNTYTIKTLPERLKKLKEDPWKDFWKIKQSLRLDELE